MPENPHTRTIEINGVKLEVDLRSAKRIDTYRVGDRVKVLTKAWDGYKSSAGVITAIDAFEKLPTLVIAYIENPLASDGKINIAYLNAQCKDTEICPMSEDDIVPTRDTILTFFNAAIEKKTQEIEEIRTRKEYFLRQYGTAFATTVPTEPSTL